MTTREEGKEPQFDYGNKRTLAGGACVPLAKDFTNQEESVKELEKEFMEWHGAAARALNLTGRLICTLLMAMLAAGAQAMGRVREYFNGGEQMQLPLEIPRGIDRV
jgi:hypothetical protein